MSATCLSRSSSRTVEDTEVPIEARTKVETTEDNVDLDIGDGGVAKAGWDFDLVCFGDSALTFKAGSDSQLRAQNLNNTFTQGFFDPNLTG